MIDEEEASKAAGGDRASFDELVRRHAGPLRAFCTHLLRDAAEAEDAVQESFLRAFRALPSFDPGRRFSSWLFKIAQNVCLDILRARKAWDPLHDDVATDSPARPLRHEHLDRLEAVERDLPAKYRAVLFYKFSLDWSAAEIADQLDTSPEDVRVCLHRALQSLRERMQR